MLSGASDGLLIVTAAWTGARWGELVGLQRRNVHLDDGLFLVDSTIGALHESSSSGLWLGPPKSGTSVRTIRLPPFLVDLLRVHLAGHDNPIVFPSATGTWHRRSDFCRRVMRPAADGNLNAPHRRVRVYPVKPGLTFHGFRHGHKTWMTDDQVPDVAQAARLGHILEDRMRQLYTHVAYEMEQRLLDALQSRYTTALAAAPSTVLTFVDGIGHSADAAGPNRYAA